MMRALVAGWFSFEHMGATAGDLLVCDVVRDWLSKAGIESDTAVAPPFTNGVDWKEVDPKAYTHVVFACGPFRNAWPVDELLQRFSHTKRIGINLSMLDAISPTSNPFDLLWERNSDKADRPDIALVADQPLVPVVGLILVDPQEEYGDRARHADVDRIICELIASREMAIVEIDTRLDKNRTGLRTAVEIESVIARMDLVITTRLHGTVFALKNGVPAVVIDAIHGGGKVYPHAQHIGWPYRFMAGEFALTDLVAAYEKCLSSEAKQQANECARNARREVEKLRDEFISRII